MVKKVIIGVLFLGGGVFLLKKLLPKGKLNQFETQLEDIKVDEYKLKYGGGGTRIQQIRTDQAIAPRTISKKLNDPSWGFNPYEINNSGDFVKGANRGNVL